MQAKSYMPCTAPGVTIDNAMADSPELEMSIVDPQTSIAVLLEHRVGGIPKDSRMVFFQSALLYSTSFGQTKGSSFNIGSEDLFVVADVFRSADFTALTALLTRQAISNIWQSPVDNAAPLQQARDLLISKCVHILSNYRLHTSAISLPLGQLILPDRLQLLPLFCMSFLKSIMLRPSFPKRGSGIRAVKPSPTANERACGLSYGAAVLPAFAMLLVHANVFPILDLQDGAGEWQIPAVLHGFLRNGKGCMSRLYPVAKNGKSEHNLHRGRRSLPY